MTRSRRPGWRRQAAFCSASLICLLTMLLPGCSKRTLVPRSPDDVPGYLGAPPNLAHVEATPLRGRRILLDPGHGGFFRGAIGQGGLSEAEINLGVALYLQGLLQWAGAEVHMTRTADVDFLTPADSSLTADLAARVAICDSLAPDVFLSLHHNSTVDPDPTINETQTYYPLGREGADLDLARSIHRQLVLALDIEPARILPGGFHVLRNVSVPAVLGEPAMLSNPVIEGRLGLARSLELEAAAYFLGLRDYFAAGTPRWLTSLPDTLHLATAPDPLIWIFEAGSPQAPGLDPATLNLTCDGRPMTFHLDPAAGTIRLPVRELRKGTRLELSGRNLAGRATPVQRHVLDQRRDGPWRMSCIREGADQHPQRALFIYHNEGRPLADCGELRLSTEALPAESSTAFDPTAAVLAAAHPLPSFADRRGWLLLDAPDLPAPGAPVVEPPVPWRILERQDDGRWLAHADPQPHLGTLPAGRRWLVLCCDPAVWPDRDVPGDGWRYRLPITFGAGTDTALSPYTDPRWPVVPHETGRTLWIEALGARPLLLAGDDMEADNPQAAAGARVDTLVWQPILPAFVGARVVLDARGGGGEEQGRGPFGTRGSDLNLQVARRLAALLRGAGSKVLMLREDDSWLPEHEKVRRANLFGADLYLAIGRGAPAVRHHPGSRMGTPWAEHCAASLRALHPGEVPVTTAHDYLLRHTACPAIVVLLDAPSTATLADRWNAPSQQDAVARALLGGTAGLLQPEAYTLDIGRILAALEGRAFDQRMLSYARLDGNLPWLPLGLERSISLESCQDLDPGLPGLGGRHFLELHAGPHWQLWTLERRTDGTWHGQLQIESR